MNIPSGMSWGDYMHHLAERYPDPSTVPGVPKVPGTDELQKDWKSWAKAWRAYYDTLAPKDPEISPDGRPLLPQPGASDEEWKAWGEAMAVYFKNKTKEQEAEAEHTEGSKSPS